MLIDKAITEGDCNGVIIYIALCKYLANLIGYICIIGSLTRRRNVWLNRLNLFSLGLPDGVIPVEENLLAALKEEIAKNGFNESLLEESDIVSYARANNLLLPNTGNDEDQLFPFSDGTESFKEGGTIFNKSIKLHRRFTTADDPRSLEERRISSASLFETKVVYD